MTGRLVGFLPLVWLLLGFVSPGWAGDAPRLVRVGAFNYYPAIFLDDDGQVKGFFVDMLDEIAGKENLRFEFVYGSWNEGLERLRRGEVDVLTSVAYTEERAAYLDYGRIPLLTVWGELYVRDDATLAGIKDVDGKTIAVMKGDYNGNYFVELVANFNLTATFVKCRNFEEIFQLVSRGQADAGVVNAVFGEARQGDFGLRSTGVIFSPFDIYFAVAKGQNPDLLDLFDSYLAHWKGEEDSIYYQARLKWGRGDLEPEPFVPPWVYHLLAVSAFLVVAGLAFILLLRRRVRLATQAVVQREAHLREKHEAYLSILETAHDGFWLTDSQGRLLDVNETYARQSGYSREELLGLRIADLDGRETFEETVDHIQRVMERGSDLFESVHRRKDGSLWEVEVSCAYNPSSGGRFFVFSRDISERKQAEQALREKNREMERFIYTVSHDLRSPLVTIKAFLGFLKQDLGEAVTPDIAKDMVHMEAAAGKMESLLGALLQLSRVGRIESMKIDVGFQELVKEGLSAVAGRIAERNIAVSVAEADFILHGDPLRLAQIWQNLIENAVKYMGDQARPRIEIGVEDQGAEVIFFVRDNGMGLDAEHHDRIFELFEKLDKAGEGSGLGLALVKKVVETYKGRIWVESQGVGMGSCFRFTLPEACAKKGRDSHDR